jgi:hypothetical protein
MVRIDDGEPRISSLGLSMPENVVSISCIVGVAILYNLPSRMD